MSPTQRARHDGPRPWHGATLTRADLAACMPDADELALAMRQLRRKTAIILSGAVLGYLGLLFASSPLQAILSGTVLVICAVGIGTCVMHDANHGAFGLGRTGRALRYTGDLIGASSYLWRQKHNVFHHPHTNVVGVDTDIEQMPFARLAPDQPWRPWYRYQHLYLWVLYGFLHISWVWGSDFRVFFRGRIGEQALTRRPNATETVAFFAFKVIFAAWAIVVPLTMHSWWVVGAWYLGLSFVAGVLLGVFFQVAHCVEEVEFLGTGAPRRGEDFADHQRRTTANVACDTPVIGPFLAWLMGGLQLQIEHHLAPGMPHTACSVLARRIEARCAEKGIDYVVFPNLWTALAAHQRWLVSMGKRPTPQVAALAA